MRPWPTFLEGRGLQNWMPSLLELDLADEQRGDLDLGLHACTYTIGVDALRFVVPRPRGLWVITISR